MHENVLLTESLERVRAENKRLRTQVVDLCMEITAAAGYLNWLARHGDENAARYEARLLGSVEKATKGKSDA